MEGETRCSGSRLSDNVTTACIFVVTEWKWVSLKQKKNFFFSETPTSPWVPFRAKFRPLGQVFHPSRPLAWSLSFAPRIWNNMGAVRSAWPNDKVGLMSQSQYCFKCEVQNSDLLGFYRRDLTIFRKAVSRTTVLDWSLAYRWGMARGLVVWITINVLTLTPN